jgi:hypothetical protein
MPLIPWIMRLAGGLLVKMTPAVISAVLRAIGITVVTYVGMDVAITAAHNQVIGNLQGLPATAAAIAGLLRLDVAIQIIFAAIAGRLALNIFSGTVRKIKL